MASINAKALAGLVRQITTDLGDSATWTRPDRYPQSLALAAIDSVYSLRANYASTVRVISRYRDIRRHEGADPELDGLEELLVVIEAHGGPVTAATTVFQNHSKAPGTRNMLKSSALARGATALVETGTATADHLRDIATDAKRLQAAKRAWLSARGLGWISWNYLLMGVGAAGVKPDVHVRAYVGNAMGLNSPAGAREAERLVVAAARELGVEESLLDHNIWRYQRSLRNTR